MINPPIRSGNSVIDFIFDACVNLLLLIGAITGLSYNAVNVIIFCVIWPILTVALFVTVIYLTRKSRLKLEHAQRRNA